MIRTTILLSACAVFANAGSLQMTLDQPIQTVPAGTFVSFSGSVANTGTDVFYVLDGLPQLPYFELTVDLSPFYLSVPGSLGPGESYSGELFIVAVSSAAANGEYVGSFTLIGGPDVFAQNALSGQSFVINVATVPEPGNLWTASLAGSAFTTLLFARRRKAASALRPKRMVQTP